MQKSTEIYARVEIVSRIKALKNQVILGNMRDLLAVSL